MTNPMAENSTTGSVWERVLLAGLALFLALVSIFYATLGGWSGSGFSKLQRLDNTLPVLLLSTAIGLGAVALALKALRRSAWSPWLLLGTVPTVVQTVQILSG